MIKYNLNIFCFLTLALGIMLGIASCGDSDANEGLAFQRELDDNILQEYFDINNLSPSKMTSGLYVDITETGIGGSPRLSDTVSVHYVGTFLNGDIFDTSRDRQEEPAKFLVGGTIAGFQEGLQQLQKGGKGSIYIPSHLGYGPVGSSGIPPNAILIFDVELFDFF